VLEDDVVVGVPEDDVVVGVPEDGGGVPEAGGVIVCCVIYIIYNTFKSIF
jgi:hypothetical protein